MIVSTPTVTSETIETILKDKGRPVPGTFVVETPHPELRVTAEGFRVTPAMGLKSRETRYPDGRIEAELALLEDEVWAIRQLAESLGLSTGEPFRRFQNETPRILFLPVHGDPARLSQAVREARRKLSPGPTRLTQTLDQPALERVLGKAKVEEGVLRFRLKDGWAAFQGTMERALATGEKGQEKLWRIGPAEDLARALK